jgi:hypothetical protein
MSMAKWEFEPGHTAAEFRAKHMMVTWVRGLFKDVHGAVDIDFENPTNSSFEAVIDATRGSGPGNRSGTPISAARTSSTSSTTRGSPSRAPGSSRSGRCCTR